MEEKQIVEYLKSNIRTGISFHFMPKEVRNWIVDNYRDCAYLKDDGVWDKASHYVIAACNIRANDVYALIEGYEPKEHKKGWEEFEIDQRGNFHCFKDGDMHYFFWANWGIFFKSIL